MEMEKWIPAWSTLRTLGNSWVVKVTVLIPLIGYFIIFNEKVLHYVKLATEFARFEPPGLTVPPRLLEVYFALCFISVGAAIYNLMCPATIKRYDTATNYVAGDAPHLGEFAFERIEMELQDSHFRRHYERIRNRYEKNSGPPISEEQKREIYLGVLHLHYEMLNAQHLRLRAGAAISYAAGFTLLAIPSLKVFFRVFLILCGLFWNYGWAIL